MGGGGGGFAGGYKEHLPTPTPRTIRNPCEGGKGNHNDDAVGVEKAAEGKIDTHLAALLSPHIQPQPPIRKVSANTSPCQAVGRHTPTSKPGQAVKNPRGYKTEQHGKHSAALSANAAWSLMTRPTLEETKKASLEALP